MLDAGQKNNYLNFCMAVNLPRILGYAKFNFQISTVTKLLFSSNKKLSKKIEEKKIIAN
jgi:hypothetical protein